MASNDDNTSGHDSEGVSNDREIDLREYLGILADGWLWIAGAAVIGLVLAAYLAWSQAPHYEATALMRVEGSGQNMAPGAFNGMGGGLSGGGLGSLNVVSAEGAILKSRSVLSDAVEAANLDIRVQPEFFPLIGEPIARLNTAFSSGVWSPPFGGGYAWGNESADVTRIVLPAETQSAQFTLVSGKQGNYKLVTTAGRTFLQGHIGQSEQADMPGVGQIRLFVRSITAAPGTRFQVRSLEKPAAVASLQGRFTAEEQPQGSGLLNLSLTADSPAAAEDQLNAIMNAYLEQSVSHESKQAEKRLSFLESQLPELREQRNEAQSKLAQYQSETGTLDLGAQGQSVLSRLTNLDQQIAEVDIERQQLLQEYTSKAPQIQAANEKKATLEARRDELQKELRSLPSGQSRFLELKREAEVRGQIYTEMRNTAQGLKVSKAGVTGNTYIIDNAYSGGDIVSPKRFVMHLAGLLIGAVLGALLVLTRAMLRTTIDDPADIESRLGLPVYATIPFSKAAEGRRGQRGPDSLMVRAAPDDPAVESLRSLRTSLEFALMGAGSKMLAITGPTPACGKSFVSGNLAVLAAQTGARVLLIDADLRRGGLFRRFGVQQAPGLSEVLAGEASADAATQASGVANLDIWATGKLPPNPAELLLSPRFAEIKEQLGDQYDYVIFDLPPVLNVTDATIIANHMPGIFLVVRSEHSTMDEVQQAVQRLKQNGLKTTGVIFNGLDPTRKRYRQGQFSHYGYRYE